MLKLVIQLVFLYLFRHPKFFFFFLFFYFFLLFFLFFFFLFSCCSFFIFFVFPSFFFFFQFFNFQWSLSSRCLPWFSRTAMFEHHIFLVFDNVLYYNKDTRRNQNKEINERYCLPFLPVSSVSTSVTSKQYNLSRKSSLNC